jgi:hypothetical protein
VGLAEGHQNGALYRPPRDNDDDGYAGYAIAWLFEPDENGDVGTALPHTRRDRSRSQLGV